MKDKQGRTYAKLSELKPSDQIMVDGDFDCLTPWSFHTVYRDDEGLHIGCAKGKHYLDGQLGADDDSLVGIYLALNIEPGAVK